MPPSVYTRKDRGEASCLPTVPPQESHSLDLLSNCFVLAGLNPGRTCLSLGFPLSLMQEHTSWKAQIFSFFVPLVLQIIFFHAWSNLRSLQLLSYSFKYSPDEHQLLLLDTSWLLPWARLHYHIHFFCDVNSTSTGLTKVRTCIKPEAASRGETFLLYQQRFSTCFQMESKNPFWQDKGFPFSLAVKLRGFSRKDSLSQETHS